MNWYLMQRQKSHGTPFTLPLDGVETVIGRQTVSSLTNYAQISRKHACFKKTLDGKWYIKDLGSLNGTFINGERIGKGLFPVNLGDIIGFGVPDLLDVEGFVCILCAWPVKPIFIKQENPSEQSNLNNITTVSGSEKVDTLSHDSSVSKSTCDKQCTISSEVPNNAKVPNIKEEPCNEPISSENTSNHLNVVADVADLTSSHCKQTVHNSLYQSDVKLPVQDKENSFLKIVTTTSLCDDESLFKLYDNDFDVKKTEVKNFDAKLKHDSPFLLSCDIKKPFESELHDKSSESKKKKRRSSIIYVSSSDESDQISENKEIKLSIKKEVFKRSSYIKNECKEEIMPFEAPVSAMNTKNQNLKSNQEKINSFESMTSSFLTVTPMDLQENNNTSLSTEKSAVKASVKPLVQSEQFDELGFSQREEIIIISDDDDYLDFNSSQIPLKVDAINMNSHFSEDSDGSDLESNKIEHNFCNLIQEKSPKNNCTTNEVFDTNFIKKECASDKSITNNLSPPHSKIVNSDAHSNDEQTPSCLDSSKSMEPEYHNHKNMSNQVLSLNHEAETFTNMKADGNKSMESSDAEMFDTNKELGDNDHNIKTSHCNFKEKSEENNLHPFQRSDVPNKDFGTIHNVLKMLPKYSDDSESSGDERPFTIMYPSKSVLKQSEFSSKNTVLPNKDPDIQKKCIESHFFSPDVTFQQKTNGRTLLTEAKPMQYRSRNKRGREEWFNEKNKPQEKVESVPPHKIKKCFTENKKDKKTNILKKMARPKNNLKEEIKKQIGYHIPFVKKNPSSVKHLPQTISNTSSSNAKTANLSIQRRQTQIDNEKKNKAPVKIRPENFGSRMACLLEDVPKKNNFKSKTGTDKIKSAESSNSSSTNYLNIASSNCSLTLSKSRFRENVSSCDANITNNFQYFKGKQSKSVTSDKVYSQSLKTSNNTVGNIEMTKTTFETRLSNQINNQNLIFNPASKDPRLRRQISSNETKICANSNYHTAPFNSELYSTNKPQAVISPVIHKHCPLKLSFKVNFDYMLAKLVFWPPTWLKEEIKITKPPPLVSNGVAKLPLSYDSLDSYAKALFPMMLLDTWENLFHEYKLICQDGKLVRNRFYFMVSSCSSKGNLMEVSCESVINPSVSYVPRVGEISILVLREKNTQKAVEVFGFVKMAKNESIQKLNEKWLCLPENWLQDARICKFSFLTKKKSIDIDKGRVTKAHALTYVKNKLRLADGIQYLVHSRLTQDILCPREKTFKISSSVQDKTLLFNSYNSSQTNIILAIGEDMRRNYAQPKISMIQGPPGTGKTYTIIGILQHLLTDSRFKVKILVTAPSNAAIDVIGRRLVQLKLAGELQDIKFVRIGMSKQIHHKMLPFSLDELASNIHEQRHRSQGKCNEQNLHDIRTRISNLEDEISKLFPGQESEKKVKEFTLRQYKKRHEVLKKYLEDNKPVRKTWNYFEEKNCKINILRESDIILSTLSSCRHSFLEAVYGKDEMHFSCCIVDEATQCTEPDILQPLMFGIHKLILIGDHQQLPATVNSQLAAECYFERSLYERFHLYFVNHSNKSPIHKLTEQYRMHSEICSFPSKHFYDQMLFTSPSTDIKYELFPLKPYAVFDVLGGQELSARCSKTNVSEALVITEICKCLLTCIPQNCTVGIITPYQGQRDLYTRALTQNQNYKQIEVNTVDGFQGREKDVIILSCVRANSPSGAIGFLACKKRLNVAITRAKQCLIICGHMKSLQNDSAWASLIDDARTRNVYVPVFSPDDVKILMKKISKLA